MPGEVIPPAAQCPRSATILIVEDDAGIGEFLQQLIELQQNRGLMLIEQFLSFEILIGRDHNIVKVAVGNLQIIKIANISLRGYLRAYCYITDCCEFAFLHEGKLHWVIFTPP